MSKRNVLAGVAPAALLLLLAVPTTAGAVSTYFTTQCAPCHSPDVVGSTATTCNGCHAHGTHPSSAKAAINVAGATNATSYSPGQTVSVTITGGYRTGWLRAALFDQNGNQLALSTGPNGMGGGAGYPITLTAPAPTVTGSYTWSVGWYGNQYDASGAAFGSRWTPDPNNPDHGWEMVSTNAFTVAAATAPAIALSPNSLDFGTSTVGTAVSRTTQVQNTGTAALNVSAIALCTGTEPEFTWTPAPPFTVAAGAATTLTVTFKDSDVDVDTGCLTITSNAANAPSVNLAVTGTGTAPPTPVANVSPLSLDFGAVTSGSSVTRTFTVGNAGTATLTGTIAAASGTSAEYTFTPSTFSVPAGGSTPVTVTYAPTNVGSDVGSLTVASNDPLQATIPVALTGSGVATPVPHLALDPATLDLGGVTVGASHALPVQVSNGGSAALNVTAIALCTGTSAEFTWSPAAPFSVAVGGATTLTVTYAPTAAGADTGCLTLASNDPASPTTTLALAGLGLAPAVAVVAVSPTALDFGSVTVGVTATRTFAVSNSGTAALSATVARAGTTSAEFTAAPASFSVAPGASQTVTVSYAPSGPGGDTGSFTVASNDPVHPSVPVSVTGMGLSSPAPSIALATTSLAFGALTTGTSAAKTTQIQNTGSAALNVSAITACSGTSSEFTWDPGAPLQIAAGGSSTLTVTYAPTDLGSDTGCLAVASDDPVHPTVQLALSGSGVTQAAPAIALDPTSLDFGTVADGSTAARTSQIRNTGTAALHVSAITACSGTSAEYTFTPSGPLEVAAGGSTALSVTYAPTDVGTDAGCLAVASDDPANPTVQLALTGSGVAQSQLVGDVDIDEFEVPESASPGSVITPRPELRNRSRVDARATARLQATLGGSPAYDQTIPIAIRAREDGKFAFPPYTVPAGSSGTLSWTLEVTDADPDVDRATARTRIRGARQDDGEEDSKDRSMQAPVAVATARAAASTGGAAHGYGCSSGGGLSLLGLILATGAGRLALRRRR